MALDFLYARRLEEESLRITFETQAAVLAGELSEEFDLHQELVQGIVNFYDASVHVDRGEFNAFVRRQLDRRPGLLALEWIPRVSQSQRQEFMERARADGLDDYTFKQWTPAGEWAVTEAHWADEYFPVFYAQPEGGNEAAFGIDLGSHPERRSALEQARDLGRPVATAPIGLAQGDGGQRAVLLFVPIYKQEAPIATLDERREHLLGFAAGLLGVEEIAKTALSDIEHAGMLIQISDNSSDSELALLPVASEGASEPGFQRSMSYPLGTRDWSFSFQTTPQFVGDGRLGRSWQVGIRGLLISALVASVLLLLTNRAKVIERQVDERSAELERANQALAQSNIELQQFAYIASHDLQAPLRAVAGFAQFLQTDYQDKLDDRAADFIQRIVDGAFRMQTLINDLLTFSRVESRSLPFELVVLNDIFENATANLSASIEESNAQITCDELPHIEGDRAQLSQLFQNLIGNGIKYRSLQTPHVHVSAQPGDGNWTISVRDNGIGIEARHHERIFEIFRRLHTQQEYPGTGIGLAVSQRIVRRHGGRIWLESEPGAGATFYFTLPNRSAATP